MVVPKSTTDLAIRIVQSWSGRSNYIVITAPLTEQRDLFDILRTPHEHQIQIEKHRFSIAYVDPADARDEVTLVRAVLDGWGIEVPSNLQASNLRKSLMIATRKILDRGDVPVLLLPSFHDAIEKLNEDIGAHLRAVEHSLGLRTVVGLPLSYGKFRAHLLLMPDRNVRFLHSEFGQGHLTELLRGYSAGEIEELLEQEVGDKKNSADVIFGLSGGLPVLVHVLVREARRMDPVSLQKYARVRLGSYCDRFLDWLDKPNGHIFKRLIAERQTGATVKSNAIRLEDHDWADLLLDRQGSLRSLIVGWACSDAYWRADPNGLHLAFNERLKTQDPQAILHFLEGLEPAVRQQDEYLACELICRFCRSANPFDIGWEEAERVLDDVSRVRKNGNSRTLNAMVQGFSAWGPMTRDMAKLCKARRRDENLRPEEFFAGARGEALSVKSYLQFLMLTLRCAAGAAPAQAIKSVLALPENVLQIYVHERLSIEFWSAPELGTQEMEDARQVFENHDYTPPKIGKRLSFEDLLCIGWPKMKSLPEMERLFVTHENMANVRDIYSKLRGPGAHSIDLASQDQWTMYSRCCEELLGRVGRILFGYSFNLDLPNLLSDFAQIVQADRDIGSR